MKIFRKYGVKYIVLLSALTAAGILLRVLWVLKVPTEQMYDFASYRQLAVNIKNGLGHTLDGLPVAWQGPLYPYVLGAFYKLLNIETEIAGKALNIVLSALTLVLSCPIFLRLFGGRRGRAAAATALMAFFPANIAYVNVLGTEVLFSFILFVIVFLQLFYSEHVLSYPFIGAALSLAVLTKPYMAAFPAVLAAAKWIQGKDARRTLCYAAVTIAVMCAAAAPWAVRNYRHFGRFIPVSYNTGYVRYINNNAENMNGLWMDPLSAKQPPGIQAEISRLLLEAGTAGVKAAPDLEPIFSKLSGEWIRQNPLEFLKLGFLRFNETFFNGADDIAQWAMNNAAFASDRDKNAAEAAFGFAAKLLSAAAFIFVIKNAGRVLKSLPPHSAGCAHALPFLCIAFFAAVVFVSEGQARYAFPVYPFMFYAILSD